MLEDADKFLKIAVGLGILAAGTGVGYHFGIYLPQIEREKNSQALRDREDEKRRIFSKEQAETQRRKDAKVSFDTCMSEALDNYFATWTSNCKNFGVDNKKKDCSLPSYIADDLSKTLEKKREKCLDVYKIEIK